MPANSAQRLYYDMIRALSGTSVMAIVITAASRLTAPFIEAPRALLETMNCFVAGESPESQAFVLRDDAGEPLLAVAAVPFLREGDVRGGSIDDTDATRAARFESGVRKHYDTVNGFLDEALDGARVPRIAHGAPVRDGIGACDPTTTRRHRTRVPTWALFAQSRPSAFGTDWDYVALGHIHNSETGEPL